MSKKKDHKTIPINASKGHKHLAKVLNDMFGTLTLWHEVSLQDLGDVGDARYYGVEDMFVDFYIRELDIAFEYQGKQHYVDNGFYGGQPARDRRKHEFLSDLHIKLVEVPYTLGDNFTAEDIEGLMNL